MPERSLAWQIRDLDGDGIDDDLQKSASKPASKPSVRASHMHCVALAGGGKGDGCSPSCPRRIASAASASSCPTRCSRPQPDKKRPQPSDETLLELILHMYAPMFV